MTQNWPQKQQNLQNFQINVLMHFCQIVDKLSDLEQC